MPGFIGVRFGEMVAIPPADDYVDVYIWVESTIYVGKANNELAVRTNPDTGSSILSLWSYDQVKSVRACTFSGGTFKIWTSQDSGHTWTPLTSSTETQVQLRFDELYGANEGGPIRRSVTGGTTWFDHIPVPSGRSGFGDIGASRTHIYAETNPGE